MRVLVFSERLAPPFDEGIKIVTVNLVRELRASHEVAVVTVDGVASPELAVDDVAVGNRLLLSRRLAERIRAFSPERVCYVPTASATPWSFLRARVLGRFSCAAPVSMIALQPRRVTWLTSALAGQGVPERVLVQSRRTAHSLERVATRVLFVPVGVDRERFLPATDDERRSLRLRFGVDPAATVALHVGHLNRNRNVQALVGLQRLEGVQVVLLASTSTHRDPVLAGELRAAGVTVVTQTLPDPESIYRLADLYVFPCSPDRPALHTPAVEIPLSVLEAMACDLPVAVTRFGGLPDLFEGGGGVTFVENSQNSDDWRRAVRAALSFGRGCTRSRTAALSWRRFAEAAAGSNEAAP